MKTTVYFKQFLPALATLVTVGFASSCQDQNFDWDEAHANTAREKFTNVFVKAYGKPAEDHQWGFDFAEFALEGVNTKSRAVTRANISEYLGLVDDYYKQEFDFAGLGKVYDIFEVPNDITEKEHKEVFAWFTNHKVEWAYTPTNYATNTSRASKLNGTIYENKVIATEISTNYTGAGYGSLLDVANYQTINHVGSYYTEDVNIHFFNGWLQNVARDDEKTRLLLPQNNGLENGKKENAHEQSDYGTSLYDGTNMDYMAFRSLNDPTKWVHANDFNHGYGYGWGRQPSNDSGQKWNSIDCYESSAKQNAGLIMNADFNIVTYGCSVDESNPHCKYLLVYLKGEDYEGYYLGLDLEGYKPSDPNSPNMTLSADGICNDWIIKIGDAGTTQFNPARIMCEDLGGENNSVTIGSTTHISDIDYNDIVIDVDNKNDRDVVSITLRAAGGTLPLIVTYGDEDILFETHEFFELKKAYDNVTSTERQNSVNYGTMWNTLSEKNRGTSEDLLVYKLFFNGKTPSSGETSPYKAYSSGTKFSLNNLKIKVYRNGLENYKRGANTSIAEWLTLGNIKGSAPLKICVPQSVKWLQERHAIHEGYGETNFKLWVTNPSKKFWENWIIYNPSYETGTATINNTVLCPNPVQ